ncbi:MAG TPA: hypothetical protein VEH27_09450 [Methylomirabilota bacterium]|nr:hypothetical protein [Methylomirabilota bacterium]
MIKTISKALFGLVAGALIATAADAPANFKVGEFTFSRPTTWEWLPAGGMRKANLKIPGAKETGEVVFFEFPPGQGGAITPNVNRWLGQFEEPREKINSKVDNQEIGGKKVTFVSAEGTYKSGMPGGPTKALPNHALRGAIIESDAGNVFIRMIVPKDGLATAEPEFKKMVESALKK